MLSEYIQNNYFISGNALSKHGYGVLILTRFNCWFFEKQFENSQMARSLLIAEVINRDILVCTAHFESLDNANIRKTQMEESFKIVKESEIKNVFVVGDYNFDSTWKQEEDVITNHGMKDIVSNFFD